MEKLLYILDQLAATYALGPVLKDPTPVTGGLLHRIWRLTTTRGMYAVKQLNSTIITTPLIKQQYEISEQIAALCFNKGIPTLKALSNNNNFITEIEGYFFIIYPWIEGNVISTGSINREYAQQIGTILGHLHTLTVNNNEFNDLIAKKPTTTSSYCLEKIIASISSTQHPFLERMHNAQKQGILNRSSIESNLNQIEIVSHRDMDQKNVLWHNNRPVILDWESVGFINPTHEIVTVALEWSGLHHLALNREVIKLVIDAYQKSSTLWNKEDAREALEKIKYNFIEWLLYNVQRSNTPDPHEKEIALQEIPKTLSVLEYFCNEKDSLMECLTTF